MSYLIISIYDSGHGFSVCSSGLTTQRKEFDDDKDTLADKIYFLYINYSHFEEAVKIIYGDNYDLIVICENGEITTFEK